MSLYTLTRELFVGRVDTIIHNTLIPIHSYSQSIILYICRVDQPLKRKAGKMYKWCRYVKAVFIQPNNDFMRYNRN